MEFFISLVAGLIGVAIVAYALREGFERFNKVDDFVENVVRKPKVTKWWRESSLGFWIIIGTMFLAVIEIAQWIGEHLAGVSY